MRIETRKIEYEIARQELSYKETARRARITEKTLQNARHGAKIRTATAGRIAAALGVPIEAILKGE